ncbi:hypothetical protein A359_08650 [secondary endosymbiont of Ctenarytaina eucalypti]|uniref:Uncharacterized protein n=1 Tax=secondary endosymbiont of Ctenarytaina eucalypti TaxID=1199245 RepID=J3VTD3_9ENTR|nr:hypothetical protein A359_08650 [secondary endosymbiont of Ctenarytaina eucalypti]
MIRKIDGKAMGYVERSTPEAILYFNHSGHPSLGLISTLLAVRLSETLLLLHKVSARII